MCLKLALLCAILSFGLLVASHFLSWYVPLSSYTIINTVIIGMA